MRVANTILYYSACRFLILLTLDIMNERKTISNSNSF